MTADLFSAAREARDEGIARADAHAAPEWKDRALETVRELAETQPTVIVDEVWDAGLEKPAEARRIGPVLLEAARRGWIERTELKRPSAQPGSHMNLRAIWRSRLYAPNSYEAEGRERKARALAGAIYRLDRDMPGAKPTAPLSERAAAMPREWWDGIHQVVGRGGPPSEATIDRVLELLRGAERMEKAG